MRYLITTLTLTLTAGLLVACAENAQPKNEPPVAAAVAVAPAPESPEKVEAEILQLEKDWVAAIVNKDLEALDRILASDFNGTSPTGSTFPKDRAIADLKAGSYIVEKMVLDEASVNVYGDTAVVFTSQQEKSKYDGKENSGHYHFTNVWVKRDGKWQVVASHGSRYQ
jgi:ketosteroid isomerase-like protein